MHYLHHLHHLFHPLRLLLALSLLASVVPFVILVGRYVAIRRRRPKLARADVVYQESFASGASQKNILTQIGGAHNCLRLIVTKEFLRVTSWFPFSLITAAFDLEHDIPLHRIASVARIESFGRAGLLLACADDRGMNHLLKLYPQKLDAFLRALSNPDACQLCSPERMR